MPRLRLDREGTPQPNGSVPVYADWMGGPSLAAIRNCPIAGTDYRRSARITAEPDTYFSQPAEVILFGVKVKGYITTSDEPEGYEFRYYRY